jgi:hypothetical protein
MWLQRCHPRGRAISGGALISERESLGYPGATAHNEGFRAGFVQASSIVADFNRVPSSTVGAMERPAAIRPGKLNRRVRVGRYLLSVAPDQPDRHKHDERSGDRCDDVSQRDRNLVEAGKQVKHPEEQSAD